MKRFLRLAAERTKTMKKQYNMNMQNFNFLLKSKILVGFLLFIGLSTNVLAQPTVLYTGLSSTTPAASNSRFALNTVGAFKQIRFQANQTAAVSTLGWAFHSGTTGSPNYSPSWRPGSGGNTMSVNTFIPTSFANGAVYSASGTGTDGLLPAITNGNYYTFNVANNATASNVMSLLETNFNPTVLSTVSFTTPANTNNGSQVTVTAATAPAVGEYVYVRYSFDSYVTSTLVQVSFSGTTGTAFIPCRGSAGSVSFYVYSSNKTAAQINTDVTGNGQTAHDMATLNLNNNAGANFSYTQGTGSAFAGVYNVPSSCYATIASFVTALNAATITGPVTCVVADGYSETAPTGGYSITANGTSANTIIFQRSNSGGAKPIITAPLWTAGGTTDGIFKIIGGDYITIDGFTIQENASNTVTAVGATNTMTEMAIGLFLTTATNGAQNNTIKNNTITLNSIYANSVAIFSSSASSSTNTALAASATTGTNSSNKIYGNTISNVAYGVYVISPANTATIIENGWDIGGSSASTGNTITFGSVTTSTLVFTSFSAVLPAAITFRNANTGQNVSYNTITSNSLAYAQTSGLGGIVHTFGTAPTGITHTNTISNNTITLTNTSTTAITGIDFGAGLATGTIVGSSNNLTLNQTATAANAAAIIGIKANYASATNTCSSNTIVFNQSNTTGALSSATTGITLAGAGTTLTASSNTVTFNQTGSGTATITGAIIGIDYSAAATTINSLSNTVVLNQTTAVASGISNAFTGLKATTASTTVNIGGVGTGNTVTVKQAFTGSGTYGAGAITYIDLGTATHATANVLANTLNTTGSTVRSTGALIGVLCNGTVSALYNIKSNTATIDRVAASGSIVFTSQSGTPSNVADTVSSNTITFTNLAGTTTATGISQLGGPSTPTGLNKNINNNTINISGTNTGTTLGITLNYTATSNVKNNGITISCVAPTVTGINTATSASAVTLSGNTLSVTTSTTSLTTLTGINILGGGAHSVTNNTFTTIAATGILATGGTTNGIAIAGGTAANVFGNHVTNISVGAATSSGSPTINGIIVSAGTSVNIYRNKIQGISSLCAGATTVANGILVSGGTTNNIYNNLIGNLTSSASANADGIRGIAFTSTTASSTQNVYYNTIYLNGTSSGATFGGSGVFHTISATATTSALDLRNNIIINAITPNGAALAVAYRRSTSALTNYSATSDKNDFFGTSGLFTDGTNTYTTLASFKTAMSTRDQASQNVNPTFLSTVGSNVNYLHIDGTFNALGIEASAGVIATYTTDYDGQTRDASLPDIGADEFVATVQCATPTSPTNSATGVLQTTSLTWTAVTNATSYDVYFGTYAAATNIVNGTNQTATTYTPASSLSASTTYYWKIVPKNSVSTATGCTIWSFTTSAANPTLSVVTSPAAFGNQCQNVASSANSFTISGVNLTGTFVTITAPSGFTVSEDNITFASSINVNHSSGSLTNKTIYVKFTPTTATAYSANVVINGGGLSANVNALVTGTGLPASTPTVSISASPSTTFCAGTNVTFTAVGANLNSTSVTNYQWFVDGSSVQSSASATYASTGFTNAQTVYCIITTSAGCVTSTSATSATSTLTVNATPVVTISSSINSYCGTTPLALTGNGATTYTWSPITDLYTDAAGTVAYVALANASVVYSKAQSTLNYTATGTTSGCSSTGSKSIAKGAPVTLGTVTAAQPSACAGGTVQLNGSATVSSSASSYAFAATSGTYNSITGGTVISDGSVTTLDSYVSGSITIPAFVFAGVTYTTAWMASNGSLNLGGAAPSTTAYNVISTTTGSGISLAVFNADLYVVSSATSSEMRWQQIGNEVVFQWKNFRRYLETESFSFQARLNTVTGVITYVYGGAPTFGSGTSYQPIVGIRTSATDFKNVQIGSGAATWAAPNIGAANTDVCRFTTTAPSKVFVDGQTYSFTPPSLTYLWTKTNVSNLLSSTTITNPVATVNATDTYTFTATGSDGCFAAGNATINLGGGAPTVTALSSVPSICVGGSATLSNTITGGCSPFTYSWSDGSTVVSSASSFSATPTSTKTYTLTVTDNNGSIVASAVTVTVNSLPTVTVNSGAFCTGGTAVALTASGASTYSWSPATDLSATAGASVNASPTVTRTYTVTGTDGNGCISTANSVVTSNQTPTTISVAQSPAAVCSGSVASLSATGAQVGLSAYMAPVSPTTQGGSISSVAYAIGTYYQIFDVLQATTLVSIDVFPTATVGTVGTISIANSAGTILTSANYTVTNSSGTVAHTVVLNYPLAVGTAYRIGQGGTAISLNRNTTNQTYPVSNSYISITGNNFSAAYWYYIYNWNYSSVTQNSIVWSPTTNLYTDLAATTAYTGGNASTVYALNTAATTYTASSTNGSCVSSAPITTVINPLPTITVGTSTAVCAGGTSSSLSFSATSGSPNQYTIDFNAAANTAGFVDVTSFTAFTTSPIALVIPAGAAAGTYNGTITVKNSNTGCVSTTYPFTVTIYAPVVITTPPNNSVSLEGTNATFSVVATGSGLTYQWQLNTGSGFANISGANSTSYTELAVTAAMSGYQYQCIVSGTSPCSPVTSSIATLTISTTSITIQPANTTICSNESAIFTIATSGTLPTYQWQLSTNGGSTWADISGETGTTLTLTGLTSSSSTYQYRCSLNSGAIYSDPATLTVNNIVTITSPLSTNTTACANAANIPLTVSATGTGLTYQWKVNTGSGFANVASGGTSASYTVTPISAALDLAQYQVVVSGLGTCVSQSSTTTLKITGVTVTSSITSNACLPDAFTLTVTPTTSAPTMTYSWLSTAGSGASTAVTGSPASITPTSAGSYTYTLTATGGGCTLTSTKAVTVSAKPDITTYTASPATVCSGGSVAVAATSISSAAGTATIGTGAVTGTSYDAVFYHFYGGNKTQHVVLASELLAAGVVAGNITSLRVNVPTGGGAYGGFAISIASTSNANMSAGINNTASFSTVFTSASYTTLTGNNTFTFSAPYNWDGVSNIIVQFCWSNNNTGGTSNYTTIVTTSYVSTAYYRADSQTSAAICGGTTATGTTSNRPLFIFGGQVGSNLTSTLNWSWNTSPAITAATGSTTETNLTGTDITKVYTVTATNPTTGCFATANTTSVTIKAVPAAPTAAPTSVTQCGSQIPTLTFTGNNSQTTPFFNWYDASTAGNIVNQTGSMQNYFTNNFASTVAPGTISGNASLSTGVLNLTPNLTTQAGAYLIPASGVSLNQLNVNFQLITGASGLADGLSYSFGDDVSATDTRNSEYGSGSKLIVSFDEYGTTPTAAGIRVFYAPSTTLATANSPGETVGSNGILAYSSNVSWVNTSPTVNITINQAGQLTLIVGGTTIFTNVQLPAGFLSADKATWSHLFRARSGGVAGLHSIDNLTVNQATVYNPGNTYPSVVSSNVTYYVSETVGSCESARTPISITVTPSPTFTLSASTGANCGGAPSATPITITAGASDFDTYTWAPNPSTVSGNATTGWVFSPTVSTVYTLTATQSAGTCGASATVSITTTPASVGGTATASTSQICNSGTSVLTLTGNTGSIQWQSSPDNTVWTNVATGGTSATYTTPTLTSTTYFRANVTSSSCASAQSNVLTITVNNPSVLTTTPSTICGTGPAILAATGSAGSTLNWYAAATGGSSLGTGPSFTTPSISSTTSYFVEATTGTTLSSIPGDGDWQHVTTTGGFQTSTSTGMTIVVSQTLTLASLDIYPSAAIGTAFSIVVRSGTSTGTILQTYSGSTTVQNSVTPTVAQTVPTNFTLAPGTYHISFPTTNPNTWRSGAVTHSFPWAIPGYISVNYDLTPSYQYYFYNLKVSTPCASSRTQVTATVNTAPAFALSSAAATICNGSSTTTPVTITTGASDYQTYTWSPATGVTGNNTAGWTFNPTTTTNYTLNVSQAAGTCINSAPVVLTVNPIPTSVSAVASASTICNGGTVDLTSSANGNDAVNLNYTEGFESGLPTGWLLTNASSGSNFTVSAPTYGSARTGSNVLQYYYNASAANSWAFTQPFNLVAGVTYTVSSWYKTYASATWTESFKVTVGNAQTVAAQTTVISTLTNVSTPTGAYVQQTGTFTPTTSGVYYFAWNCFSAASQWMLNIDDISITGSYNPALTYAWTSSPAGYTSATQNPTGVAPTVNTTYTVEATNSFGCKASNSTSQVVVNPVPTAVTFTPSTQNCIGIPTASVADANGYNTPTFKWYTVATGGVAAQSSTSTTYTSSISTTTIFYVSVVNPVSGCESPRVAVTATVVPAPTFTLSSGAATICNGTPTATAITITAGASSYDTYTWSPSSTGITGNATTGWIFNPASTTTYTLNVSQTAGTCTNSAPVSITVKPLPAAVVLTASNATPCQNDVVTLNASSSTTGSAIVGTSTGPGAAANTPYRQAVNAGNQSRVQYLITKAELNAAGINEAANLNSLGFNVSTAGTGTMPTYTISMVNTSLTALTATYQTPSFTTVYNATNITPVAGINTHSFSTPFAWDGTSNILVNICHGGAAGTASAVDSYTPAALMTTNGSGNNQCNLTTGGATNAKKPVMYFGYTIVNPIAWTSTGTADIFTNSPATTPYTTGANMGTVYIKTPITATYTATATGSNGCPNPTPQIITIQNATNATVATTVGSPLSVGDYLWNGKVSANWETVANWYSYDGTGFMIPTLSPDATNRVFVLTNTGAGSNCISSLNPATVNVIVGSGLAKDVFIGSGATMLIDPTKTLSVSGNWTNNGTFSPAADATVKFNGTGAQVITGSNTTTFTNLEVNKTAGVLTLNKAANVSGLFTMTAGDISTTSSNLLTVGLSAATPGSLAWTSGSIQGPIKRYFSGTANASQASGIFPVGLTGVNRYAQVNYTAGLTTGGSITAEYKSGACPILYAGLPNTVNGQMIQNYENEGYWEITPNGGDLNTATYSIILRGNTMSTVTSSTEMLKLRIIKSTSHTSWEMSGIGSNSGTTGGVTDFTIANTGMTGFSWFNIGSGNANPLPVTLVNFAANCNDKAQVNVKWTTASEQNSESFIVERSRDLVQWELLATIPAAGNSNYNIDYSTFDVDPLSDVSYYRLVQIDNNGIETLYEPISVSCSDTENSMIVFPNPTKGNFTVEISSDENISNAQIQITDLTGKVINERSANILEGKSQFTFEGLDLQLGTYIINLNTGNGKINPVRVVVN